MNTSKLIELAQLLIEQDAQCNLQSNLTAVYNAIANLVSSPGQPEFQKQFSQAYVSLNSSVKDLMSSLTPTQLDLISEIGGGPYFTEEMDKQIVEWNNENSLTPAVVQQKIAALMTARADYIANLNQLLSGMKKIGLEAGALQPGQAELGFLLPRPLFKNDFSDLITELDTVKKILNFFAEAMTGSSESIQVQQISTSDPIFGLIVNSVTAYGVMKAITWAVSTCKTVDEIRVIRLKTATTKIYTEDELKSMFDDKIEEILVKRVTEQVSAIMQDKSPKVVNSNELEVKLTWALNNILYRIERGMRVELRFLPLEEQGATDNAAIKTKQMSDELVMMEKTLIFPKITGEPVLKLPPPLENEKNSTKKK